MSIFQILGTDYKNNSLIDEKQKFNLFTIDFQYDNAVASIKVVNSVKSEVN